MRRVIHPGAGQTKAVFNDLNWFKPSKRESIVLLNQIISYGVVGKFGVRAELHLVQYSTPVGADCLITQR